MGDQTSAPAAALSFDFRSVMRVSVVSIIPAIDAAFCRAERTTYAGSMIPAWTMFTKSCFLASQP